MLGQTLPSTVPLATSHLHRSRPDPAAGDWPSFIEGRKFHSTITHEQITEGPEWTPSAALPLTLDKAEQVARVELHKIVNDHSSWEVSEFVIRPFREGTQTWWFYVVRLRPKESSDHFELPVSFSGEPGQLWMGEALTE